GATLVVVPLSASCAQPRRVRQPAPSLKGSCTCPALGGDNFLNRRGHVYSLLRPPMIPFLHLGPLTIPTFGLMVATALFVSAYVLQADFDRRRPQLERIKGYP